MEPWGLAPLELRLTWFKPRRAPAATRDQADLNRRDLKQVVMAHGEWQPEQMVVNYLERGCSPGSADGVGYPGRSGIIAPPFRRHRLGARQ